MQKTQIKTNYGTTIASSLVRYAQKSPSFASLLKERASFKRKIETSFHEYDEEVDLLELSDLSFAIKRLEWFIDRVNKNQWPATKESVDIVQSFVEESPQQIIIGIAPTDIIGITLGQIKRKVYMAFLINQELIPEINLKVAEKIAQTSSQVFQDAFERACGDVKRIEPETAEWFFGDKNISFYNTDKKNMKKIEGELKSLHLPYSATREKEEIALLAISPSLNGDDATLHWNVKPLQ